MARVRHPDPSVRALLHIAETRLDWLGERNGGGPRFRPGEIFDTERHMRIAAMEAWEMGRQAGCPDVTQWMLRAAVVFKGDVRAAVEAVRDCHSRNLGRLTDDEVDLLLRLVRIAAWQFDWERARLVPAGQPAGRLEELAAAAAIAPLLALAPWNAVATAVERGLNTDELVDPLHHEPPTPVVLDGLRRWATALRALQVWTPGPEASARRDRGVRALEQAAELFSEGLATWPGLVTWAWAQNAFHGDERDH